jgi:hypothetical protein
MVHNGADLGAKKSQKEPEEYHCKKCDFFTCKLGNWKRHLKTKKHNGAEWCITNEKKRAEKTRTTNADTFVCECGKTYKYHQGYYRHKNKCNWQPDTSTEVVVKDESVKACTMDDIVKALKDQAEMCRELLQENQILKAGVQQVTNNNVQNIGTQNNTNIMLYLNTECGQAMSIQDFVDRLSLTISDLKRLKDDKPLAIADIVRQNLEPLSLNERPMHSTASDWYVKDKQEGWQEDDGEKIVKNVEHGIIKNWSKVYETENPDWLSTENGQNEYVELTNATTSDMAGTAKSKLKNKIAKECSIKKS